MSIFFLILLCLKQVIRVSAESEHRSREGEQQGERQFEDLSGPLIPLHDFCGSVLRDFEEIEGEK